MLERDEPPRCRLHRLPTGYQAVVAEDGCFSRSEGLGDLLTFRCCEHGSVVDVKEDVILVECEAVLRDEVERAAQAAECSAVQGVRVRDAVDLGPCSVNWANLVRATCGLMIYCNRGGLLAW